MQSRFLALATCLWRLLGRRFTVKQHGVADRIASVVASERFERLWLVNASALDQQTEQNEDDQHGAQGDEVDPEAAVSATLSPVPDTVVNTGREGALCSFNPRISTDWLPTSS